MLEAKDSADVTPSAATRVYLLAAAAANGVIGAGNALPWHLPEDLEHFKQLTLGHPIIMGRKTFDSILAAKGKLLPGREHIVISRQRGLEIPGVSVASSLEGALALCLGEPIAFVIGGAEIFELALPLADGIVLTEIKKDFAGDTKFPDYERGAFREAERQAHVSSSGLAFDFVLYERVR